MSSEFKTGGKGLLAYSTAGVQALLGHEFIDQSMSPLRFTMLKTKNRSSLNTPYPIFIPRTFVPSVRDFLIQTVARIMAVGSGLSFPGKNNAAPIFFFRRESTKHRHIVQNVSRPCFSMGRLQIIASANRYWAVLKSRF